MRHGPEAAALDEHGLVVQHLGGLEHLAGGGEHHGVGQPVLDEAQREQAVVDVREGRAAHAKHVDLDAVGPDAVDQRGHQSLRISGVVKSAVDEVDADDAQRLLLEDVFPVPHADMDDDLAGLGEWFVLKPDPQPAMAIMGSLEALGDDCVGEHEEPGAIATFF